MTFMTCMCTFSSQSVYSVASFTYDSVSHLFHRCDERKGFTTKVFPKVGIGYLKMSPTLVILW